MLALLLRWLDERRTLEALEVVTIAMRLRGTRADADLLRTFESIPEEGVRQLIADTQ